MKSLIILPGLSLKVHEMHLRDSVLLEIVSELWIRFNPYDVEVVVVVV